MYKKIIEGMRFVIFHNFFCYPFQDFLMLKSLIFSENYILVGIIFN